MNRRRLGALLGLVAAVAAGPSCGGDSPSSGAVASEGGSASGSSSGAGGSGSGGSSGGSGSGATGGDASTTGGVDASGGVCLGSSLLGALGKSHLIVGGTMADATATQAPFDVRT